MSCQLMKETKTLQASCLFEVEVHREGGPGGRQAVLQRDAPAAADRADHL